MKWKQWNSHTIYRLKLSRKLKRFINMMYVIYIYFFVNLAWYCWKQGLQVIGMQNASVSIKSTKLNSSKVEASTISSSFTESHVLPNLSNWFFFCVNKFSKEFDFLHVLIYYVIKKQDYAFWHIYNAHEIP